MKKSALYELIRQLKDDHVNLQQRVAGLEARFDETRQTVNALTDKLDAEEANAAVEADLAEDYGWSAPADLPTPRVTATEAKAEMDDLGMKVAQQAAKRIDRIIMDDIITEKNVRAEPDFDSVRAWFNKTKNTLTAEDVYKAAEALQEHEDTTDPAYYFLPEPTDEDLDAVDRLMDELLADHDTT